MLLALHIVKKKIGAMISYTDKIPPDHEKCKPSGRNTPKTYDNIDAEDATRNTASTLMANSLFLSRFLMVSANFFYKSTKLLVDDHLYMHYGKACTAKLFWFFMF